MDEALARLNITTAVGTEPPATWYNLGNEFLQERDWDCARACYLQTLKINPGLADAYANLGVALSQKKETKAAVDAWQKALEINPDQVYVLNNLAWLLAASPDPAWRDGARAEALARHACQLTGGNPMMLRTLAAAYGREGSYELAAATAKRALELAVAQKNDGLAATLETEITRYEANTPVEEPAP
jgi:tetratricopeptide (TPR) repeat protein